MKQATELTDLFDLDAPPIEARGNAPFLLHEPETVWLVQRGRVDVFAVRVESGEASGPRTHLFRAQAGQLLFGLPPVETGTGLLASGTTGTRLHVLRRPQVEAWATALPARAAALLDGWLVELGEAAAPRPLATTHTLLAPSGEWVLDPDEIAHPQTRVLWICLREGEAHLLGRADLPLAVGDWLPLSPRTWVQAASMATLTVAETATRLADGQAWSALAHYHERVLRIVTQNLAQVEAAERDRLQRKAQQERTYLHSALSRLAATTRVDEATLFLGEDITDDVEAPLVVACRLVGGAMGIRVRPRPDPVDGKVEAQTLDGIARASHFAYRQVALREPWWRQDHGPLLAFREADERPVALLPVSPRRYILADPVEQTRTVVTEAVADTLQPFAYSFYRTFPKRALRVWDVLRFGLRGNRGDLATIALMGIGVGLLALVPPIATGIIFDTLIPQAALGQLVQVGLALVVAALAAALFQLVQNIAVLRVEAKMDLALQAAVWERLMSLPVPFFRRYAAGDLALRALGINRIRQTLTGVTLASILTATFSLFSFALLFVYSVPLALVATALVGAYVLFTTAAGLAQVRYERALTQVQGQLAGLLLQFMTGIAKLRVAGAEGRAFARWADEFSDQKRLAFRARGLANQIAVWNATFPVLAAMLLFAMLAFSSWASLSTGEFLAFNAAFTQFLVAMVALSSSLVTVMTVVPTYERARPILRALPEWDEIKADPGTLTGEIEVNHLSFRYAPDGPLVLKDVSLRVRPGEFVALVGPSGSGKSTLLRLLLGFEQPEQGAIYYNGHDLAGLDLRLVRRQIGVVLQDGKIMPGDIFRNIVGSAPLTMQDAWAAARMAGLEADIERMPMGMHTVLTEGASTLSGGQKQRLLIARALVKKPRLLFFDEATSALDNRTQAVVSESLEALQATRIVIAHRLSTIVNADRIVVLQDGKLVQLGTYDDLVQEEGLFRTFVERQTI